MTAINTKMMCQLRIQGIQEFSEQPQAQALLDDLRRTINESHSLVGHTLAATMLLLDDVLGMYVEADGADISRSAAYEIIKGIMKKHKVKDHQLIKVA